MGIDLDQRRMMSMGTRLRIDRLVHGVGREWRVDGCVYVYVAQTYGKLWADESKLECSRGMICLE
jgi:hypothetical protein